MTRIRAPLGTRLLTRAHGGLLDADLAEGIRPSTTPEHTLRAAQLGRARERRRIASALRRAVARAGKPPRRSAQIPVDAEAVLRSARGLNELAASLTRLERPRTRGVAIAALIAFDGRGPLFSRPDTRDNAARLENMVTSANAALRVSPAL